MADNPNELTGRVMKVLSVNTDTQTVHARTADGQTTRFTILRGNAPSRGDVILLGPDRWEPAPNDAWPVSNSIATVRAILDQTSVLIDDGITIKSIINNTTIPVSVHNTVEYNDIDGIVRIVSETPIRSREFGTDRDDIIKEYLVDTSAGGPNFGDFGGYPGVVERARELVETQLDRRDILEEIGARPVKGGAQPSIVSDCYDQASEQSRQ